MSHSPEDPEADRRDLQLRLRRIIGQLKGIDRMVAADFECAEVLNQVVSARRALKSLAEKIVNDHLQHAMEDLAKGKPRPRDLKEVALMLKRYVS